MKKSGIRVIENMEKLVKTYSLISKVPSIKNGRILREKNESGPFLLSLTCSQRNVMLKEYVSFKKFSLFSVITENEDLKLLTSFLDQGSATKQEVASAYSESCDLYASVVERPGKNQENDQWLEVWDKEKVKFSWNMSDEKVHGRIRTDGMFSGFHFSPDETKLVYTAEKKPEKIVHFTDFGRETENGCTSDARTDSTFEYTETWGEQLTGVSTPLVFILDLKKSVFNKPSITPLTLPENMSFGQPSWSPDGSGIIGVSWLNLPKRLGLIYCPNRQGYIFHASLDGKFTKLSEDGCAVFSPRISPDGKKLVWLETKSGGPHHPTQRLMMIDWNIDFQLSAPQCIIDIVEEDNGIFNGIYNTDRALPVRCWFNDNKHLVFSTECRSSMKSYVVNVETKTINQIQTDGSVTGCSALDIYDNTVVLTGHSRTAPDSVLFGCLDKDKIYAKEILPPLELPIDFSHIRTTVFRLESRDSRLPYEAVLYHDMTVEDGEKQPLIVNPHGGPHSSFTDSFNVMAYYCSLLGYAILQVNFCGSTGFGNRNLLSLPGNCGINDVNDVHTAAIHALNEIPSLDPNRVGLQGGSHGGFLVTHLSGQFPDFYKAVCTRNPVVNIATMATISDIQDWCFFETGIGEYNFANSSYTQEVAQKMFSASPIAHAHKVKAPTLIAIGEKDLRVPASQGREWYYSLKSRGVKTKLLSYDDCHPISKVGNEMDYMISMANWFQENL
ncbi:acylamino-acid-releasing enzyme-like isoform X1 [Artemia franciscana]|uniref:acylamino-acid-releasing enzyme-like isoform X1 n=1 Tax=Artemia franciscana TaxID=6661 RepID=UPI0032DA4E61